MKERKVVIVLHVLLVVLETIAAVYMLSGEGLAVLRYYTVDSNILQLVVSILTLSCFIRKKDVPAALTVMQLVASVCLTVTFLIAAFVLMPQSTFYYYFVENVAPINHFFGPLLSVIVLILSREKIPGYAIVAPAAVSLMYGIVALILNAMKVLTGPYFFLEVYKTEARVIVMWFGIIFVLCVALAAVYMALHRVVMKRSA